MKKHISLLAAMGLVLSVLTSAHAAEHKSAESAQNNAPTASESNSEDSAMDELNPFDPNIEQKLQEMDQDYYESTGQLPFMQGGQFDLFENELTPEAGCYRESCAVFVRIIKSEQKAYVYVNGVLENVWAVSTGLPAYETPLLDKHPNGRIYDQYSSKKYPGGDYKGLGNMPYAIFIEGGFAIHGTVEKNFPKLGSKASHGCIRLHSDNAFVLNRLVRAFGIKQTWFKVEP